MKRLHKYLIGLSFLIGMLGFSLPARGVPAYPGERTYTLPDGSEIHLSLIGDEFFHTFVTADGLPVEFSTDGYAYYRKTDGLTGQRAHDIEDRKEIEMSFIKENLSSLKIESLQERFDLRRKAPETVPSKKGPAKANAASKGNTRISVILVQYQDKKFKDNDPKATFNSFFNATGTSSSTITQSVKEYFRNQSKNQYIPTFDLYGPVTLSGKRADYGGNDANGRDKGVGRMVAEAVLACDSQIDYSKYDYTKDGYCDTVIILYAGDGEASSKHSDAANSIWPCHWSLFSSDYGQYLTLDNIRVNSFGVFNELNGANLTKIDGIGTVVHEFSHCLGLPDFYDTNYSSNFGMGYWSVMDNATYNNGGYTPLGYSAYEKEFMGWFSTTESQPNTQYTLSPMNQISASSEEAVKIISDSNPDEYFILENRKKQGWDEYMEAEGLMITHVTYDEAAWRTNQVNTGLQRMTIMPADNNLLMSVINGMYTPNKANHAGDLWPYNGNNAFTDTSSPAAKLNSGGSLGKPVTEIMKNSNGTVSLWVQKGAAVKLSVPTIETHTVHSSTSATLYWNYENLTNARFSIELTEQSDAVPVFDHKLSIIFLNESNTKKEGWTTEGFMQSYDRADGNYYLNLGGKDEHGSVTSPSFKSDATGNVTVKFRGCYNHFLYKSKVEVALIDSDNKVVSRQLVQLNGDPTDHEVLLKGQPNKDYKVRFASIEYIYVCCLYSADIYTGNVVGVDVTTITSWTPPTPTVHSNLSGTSFKVSNLKAGAKYNYRMKAVALNTQKFTDSDWSDYRNLDLSQVPTGIEDISFDVEEPEEYFNLAGQKVESASSPGIYIVRKNGRTFKIIR